MPAWSRWVRLPLMLTRRLRLDSLNFWSMSQKNEEGTTAEDAKSAEGKAEGRQNDGWQNHKRGQGRRGLILRQIVLFVTNSQIFFLSFLLCETPRSPR